jgi:hypothetical protein
MTRTRSSSRTNVPDSTCAEAVDVALAAAQDVAGRGQVGEHLGVIAEGERVATHFFAARERGYAGWRWAVTLTRASRSKQITVDETVLLPGDGAILAPPWLPWSERLRAGDIGVGDLLPTADDDPRLEPGYTGADEIEPKPFRESLLRTEGDEDDPQAGTLPLLAYEMGLGRSRVLSRVGVQLAAERWTQSFGATAPMAQAAPAHCGSCGFLTKVAGSLSQLFGVCANEYSSADGHVVAFDFGCGGHSEAVPAPLPTPIGTPVVDEYGVDPV